MGEVHVTGTAAGSVDDGTRAVILRSLGRTEYTDSSSGLMR